MQLVYSVEVLYGYYLILCNVSGIVVCMEAGNILSKLFLSNWVAVDFRCTGSVLVLSEDYQFGAPLHTAHTVADTEGVGASMLQLHIQIIINLGLDLGINPQPILQPVIHIKLSTFA